VSSYPVILDLQDKKVVVIGGGVVAARKVKDLLAAGAVVTVIAPEIASEAEIDTGHMSLYWNQRKYKPGDLEGMFMVFIAVDDAGTAREIAGEARAKKILVNSAIEPALSDFLVPSFERRGDLLLAVSTSGASPALAARWRRELMEILPDENAGILSALKEFRQYLAENEKDKAVRSGILKHVVSSDEILARLVNDNDQPVKRYRKIINEYKK
jgi:precorrin-2 dehydrogenase / sirohydrochlorin ferrochelatase